MVASEFQRFGSAAVGGALAAILAVSLGACDGGSGGTVATVRDSAGVTVVEAPARLLDRLPEWSVDTVMVVGGSGAPPEQAFGQIQGVHRYDDGTIAVLDITSRNVRFFGPDGELQTTAGSPGSGPGQFEQPARLRRIHGDSLVVTDRTRWRLSIIGPERTIDRSVRMRGLPPSGLLHGVLDDGTMVFGAPVPGGRDASATPVVQRTFIRFYGLDGAPRDSLGPFPDVPTYRIAPNAFAVPVFSARTDFATDLDGVWVGTGMEPELIRIRRDGSLDRIVRWARPPRAVTQEHRRITLDDALARASDDNERQQVRAMHERTIFASRLPAYRRIFAGPSGRVWVEGFNPWLESRPTEWMLLGPDGEPEGTIRLPYRFRLWEVDEDYLSGMIPDASGAQRAVVLRVVRDPDPAG